MSRIGYSLLYYFLGFVTAVILLAYSANREKDATPKTEIIYTDVVMPDNYIPTRLRMRVRNRAGEAIDSVKYKGVYRSPNADTTWWRRTIVCNFGYPVKPEQDWSGHCNFVEGTPEKRFRPNAALFLHEQSISPTSRSK
jgi:hypothetical protein